MISGRMLHDCSPVSCQLSHYWSAISTICTHQLSMATMSVKTSGWLPNMRCWTSSVCFVIFCRNDCLLVVRVLKTGHSNLNFLALSCAENKRKSKVFFVRGLQMYHAHALWAKYNLRSYNFTVRKDYPRKTRKLTPLPLW